MKRFYHVALCLLSLMFHSAFATPLTLPEPTGPYAVGTKAFDMRDPKKHMLRGKEERRWMVQAFYPTDEARVNQTYPYMPGTLKGGMVAGTEVRAHSKLNAPLSTKGSFPVLCFMHGFGGLRQNATILCEELASHGYIILCPDLPYMSHFTRFTDSTTIVQTFKDVWYERRDRDYRYAYYDESMKVAMEEITLMLDQFEDLNQRYLNGQGNSQEIGILGHSFGGNVAHTLGFQDPRLKVIVDIDSKITDRPVYGRRGPPPNAQHKPALFLRGSLQYQEDVGDSLTRIEGASVREFPVEHSAFSDSAFLAAHIPALSQQGFWTRVWKWFWKTGPQFEAVDTGLGQYKLTEWLSLYHQSILEFLDQHLKVKMSKDAHS